MRNNKDFIPKKATSSNKTIRMSDELIAKLQRIAAEQDISFNKLVVQCCEYALQYLPSEQDTTQQ